MRKLFILLIILTTLLTITIAIYFIYSINAENKYINLARILIDKLSSEELKKYEIKDVLSEIPTYINKIHFHHTEKKVLLEAFKKAKINLKEDKSDIINNIFINLMIAKTSARNRNYEKAINLYNDTLKILTNSSIPDKDKIIHDINFNLEHIKNSNGKLEEKITIKKDNLWNVKEYYLR